VPLSERLPIFKEVSLGLEDRAAFDRDGHLSLPGLLTEDARIGLTNALSSIQEIHEKIGERASHYSAEFNDYLAELIAHPQMLDLARWVLGPEIRYDHCVALNRPPGNGGASWHSHEYADTDPNLGFIRIFFYVNGFEEEDGALGVVPGSHLFRESRIGAGSDEEFRSGWMAGKTHPLTGEPLEIEYLAAPPGTVILMWTHAAHAVRPRLPDSPTRWTAVYAYRNPGRESRARWISEAFEASPPPGAEGLMSLY
jgi:hypothetical protein